MPCRTGTTVMLLLSLFTIHRAGRAEPLRSPAAGAPPTTAPRGPGGAVEVVVTGTRTAESSQRSTVKTDVVSAAEAERRGATNVAEALATQPGVRVDPGAYGFLGNVSPIRIQGFDLQRVLILEDGEPVIGDVGGAVDLAMIPISDIERIEIVSGPTSALYGSSAIGGVVNILTAPPRDEGPSGIARVEGRSHRGLLLAGRSAYRQGDAWAGIDTRFFRQDGVSRAAGVPDLRIPELSRWMVGARGGTKLGDAVDLRLRARYFRDRNDGLSSALAPGAGRYRVNEPADTDRIALHAITRVELGGASNLRFTLGRQWADNTTGRFQEGSRVGEEHRRHHRLTSAEAVATFPDGDRTWVAGTRGELETFEQDQTRTESLSSGLVSIDGVEVPHQRLLTGALYGQLSWRFGDLTLLPGVRGELRSRYGSSVAPRLAAALELGPRVRLRVSAGRGYRVPSAKELGFLFDHSSLGYRVIGNPDLRPETSWGGSADVTFRPDRRFTLMGGGFANWIDQMIDIDLANGVPSSGGSVDYRYTNFGKARTMGVTTQATVRLGEGFRSELAYDYLWTRDDLNDRPLGGRPPHTITGSIRGQLPLDLVGYARFRASTDAFVSNALRAPGYQTIDLRLSRAIGPFFEASAGVLNVTDVHQEPGRPGDLRPPLGRVFYAALRAAFPGEDP